MSDSDKSVHYSYDRYDIGHVFSLLLLFLSGQSLFTAYADYNNSGQFDETIQFLTAFGLIFGGLAIFCWQSAPWSRLTVEISPTGITMGSNNRGMPIVPRQTHEWEHIQRIYTVNQSKNKRLGIELTTGKAGFGKKTELNINTLNARPQAIIDAVEMRLNNAGYALVGPKNGGFLNSEKSWLIKLKSSPKQKSDGLITHQ